MSKKEKNGYDWLAKKPYLNVIEKDEFQNRVVKVFEILGEALGKSFGPYGAPTIISNYPYTHVTKDGYTIMKNSTFDTQHGLLDCVISNIAQSACDRLNFAVGDGTTTAIMAVNNIYQAYNDNKKWFDNNMILPRDIIKKYTSLKNDIIKELESNAIYIPTDPDEMREAIQKIVYISSNADTEITDMISELYEEIGYPSITCELAKDGVTRSELVEGYQFDLTLTDKLYINTDEKIARHENVDVLIFDHKVTLNTYKDILKPLSISCKQRGRHLLVVAPFYDDVAISTVISRELNQEYKATNDVNLILTVSRAHGTVSKKALSDLAMLVNTTIIDKSYEDELRKAIAETGSTDIIMRMDDRNIEDTTVICVDGDKIGTMRYNKEKFERLDIKFIIPETEESHMRVGFIKELSIGLDNRAIFKGFYYNEFLYRKHVSEAEEDLQDAINKYAKMGTFNFEVSESQKRVIALKLKMGTIYVGADTELSQKLSKDAVDDAVRAAESAYRNGYILGCNVTLLRVITNMFASTKDELDKTLIGILRTGFMNVYKKVLSNAFEDTKFLLGTDVEFFKRTINKQCEKVFGKNIFEDGALTMILEDVMHYSSLCESRKDLAEKYKGKLGNNKIPDFEFSFHEILIEYSIYSNTVFDLESKSFTPDIINSTKTDIEVLKAVTDLMGILITGNQMVLTGKHMF